MTAQCTQEAAASSTRVQRLLTDLKTCSRTRNLGRGKQVHAEATECGHDSNIYVANSLINMYAKCGSMVDALQVFRRMKHSNAVAWTVMILGYADNGQGLTALYLFRSMNSQGIAPNSVTFVAALKACIALAVTGDTGCEECSLRGRKIHGLAVEGGFDSDVYVQSTLVDMYAKCGSMADARLVFDNMKHANVVSWNVLILGYAVNGQSLTALDLFKRMRSTGVAPDAITFMAVCKACTYLAVNGGDSGWAECRDWGRAIHNLAIEEGSDSDSHVQSTLICMYSKCGRIVDARQVFDSTDSADVVCWTALILGYAENGQGLNALNLFIRMKDRGPAPNPVTLAAALKACGLVGGLVYGRTLHREIHRGKELGVVLVTCLVDFYAKCGSLVEAQRVFDMHAESRSIVTWTALLAGFSSCGDHESAFALFERMQDQGLVPNTVTFLCILTCCSHAGLVEKGQECLEVMVAKYGIPPAVEHYTCMVGILGRANKIDDAMALLDRMPCSPNYVTWTSILGACRKWKNVEVGRLAFQSLVDIHKGDAAAHLVMGQIYASRGMLQAQKLVITMSKEFQAWKTSGESCWMNEVGDVHTFS